MTTDPEKKDGEPEDERSQEADEEEERPTVAPPFDPVSFAKQVLGGRPSPHAGTKAARSAPPTASPTIVDAAPPVTMKSTPFGGMRAPAPTLTDPDDLEDARIRSVSMGSGVPARPTPTGILSLTNARVPSNLPPRPGAPPAPEAGATPSPVPMPPPAPLPSKEPPRKQSFGAIGAVDREWEELATRPPPPGFDERMTGPESAVAHEGLAAPAGPGGVRGAADGLPEAAEEDAATRPPPPMQQDLIEALGRGDEPPSTKEAPDLAARMGEAAVRSVPEPAGPAPTAASAPATHAEMNDRLALGDYTGALEIAERLLEIDPGDDAAKASVESCQATLKKMYTARIGPLDRVPVVMVGRDQLRWLSIDHRAGFVLSLVDGVSSLEMILDVSGMPELDALRILSELAQQRIISFR